MMWVRLDCTVASHRKLLRAGAEAAWLWVCGLAHANKHTTNGMIVRDDLVALYPVDGWTPAKRRALVAKLVEVGLWEVIDADSWAIHGYAEHQSEAMTEAVEARREYERAKKRSQRDRWKTSVSGSVSRGDTQGDTDGTPTGTPVGTPQGNPVGIPPGVPDSDRPTVRPSDRPVETTSLSSPPGDPPSGATSDAPPKEAPPAKSAKARRAKPAPTPDTVPMPGTLARRVFDAILADRALAPIVANPGDASDRWADPATFPGVDVLAEVKRAGEYAATKPGRYTDGRAFLRGWLQRKADEVARAPKPATSAGSSEAAPPSASQRHAPKKMYFGDEFKAAATAAREDA